MKKSSAFYRGVSGWHECEMVCRELTHLHVLQSPFLCTLFFLLRLPRGARSIERNQVRVLRHCLSRCISKERIVHLIRAEECQCWSRARRREDVPVFGSCHYMSKYDHVSALSCSTTATSIRLVPTGKNLTSNLISHRSPISSTLALPFHRKP